VIDLPDFTVKLHGFGYRRSLGVSEPEITLTAYIEPKPGTEAAKLVPEGGVGCRYEIPEAKARELIAAMQAALEDPAVQT
jgi:hypothetical protein